VEAIEIMINAIDNYLVEGVQTTCLWENGARCFRSGILILILSKVLQCGIITKGNGARGEIAALIALQRYFEDRVRLPN
jgi:hypothetical protein